MGVGRSSLREALKILNVYGVIESRHGEGTFIVDNRARNFFKFLGFERNKENIKDTVQDEIADAIIRLLDFSHKFGIDLDFHIKAKLEYNASRPYKHGKTY